MPLLVFRPFFSQCFTQTRQTELRYDSFTHREYSVLTLIPAYFGVLFAPNIIVLNPLFITNRNTRQETLCLALLKQLFTRENTAFDVSVVQCFMFFQK